MGRERERAREQNQHFQEESNPNGIDRHGNLTIQRIYLMTKSSPSLSSVLKEIRNGE